ncbi:DUF4153 domain-containing protein [Aureimonas psammosilenae]|uniref:DUF4153 domain-containing protein n=1 Tax=Aureimonas psammosilenae TaxID=2495496 RepID=UPI0018698584|nr:DUF4153 domain-containing protein [Aureimonas psammosilenae]
MTGSQRGWFGRLATAAVNGIGRAVSRFPFASLAILCLSVVANLDIADASGASHDLHERLMLSALVAGAVSLTVELFCEASRLGRARHAVAGVIGVAAGLLMWFGTERFLFVAPVTAAALLAIPLAPHLRASTSGRFWMFASWTAIGCLLAFLSVLLFCAGGTAIFEMIRYLFDFGLPQSAYRHILVTAATLIGPLFALGRIPTDFTEEPTIEGANNRLAGGFGGLLNWVAAPLILICAAVLHVYVGKILVTGEVPKNQIGWIVTTYALFVLVLRLAGEPFLRGSGAAIRLFGRCWAAILPVPVALLCYALALRIGAEGVTTERFYLALGALAVALVLAVQIVPKLRGDIRWMAAIPIVLLALSSFGPLGTMATVARSQLSLIAEHFASSGTVISAGLTVERQFELRSRIQALHEVDALGSLLPLLAPPQRQMVEAGASDTQFLRVLEALGLEYGGPASTVLSFNARTGGSFAVGGFDRAFLWASVVTRTAGEARLPEDIDLDLSGKSLQIRYRDIADSVDLGAFVSGIVSADPAKRPDETVPPVEDLTTVGGRIVRVQIRQLTVDGPSGAINDITADLAIREADWRR